MGNFRDLTDMLFTRLKIVGICPEKSKKGGYRWYCLCECGTKKVVTSEALLRGDTKSCGCLRRETVKFGRGRRATN